MATSYKDKTRISFNMAEIAMDLDGYPSQHFFTIASAVNEFEENNPLLEIKSVQVVYQPRAALDLAHVKGVIIYFKKKSQDSN